MCVLNTHPPGIMQLLARHLLDVYRSLSSGSGAHVGGGGGGGGGSGVSVGGGAGVSVGGGGSGVSVGTGSGMSVGCGGTLMVPDTVAESLYCWAASMARAKKLTEPAPDGVQVKVTVSSSLPLSVWLASRSGDCCPRRS